MLKVQGLIFDLDGTLIDSRRDIAASVNHTLAALGLAPLPEKLICDYVGDGVKNLLSCCLKHFGKEEWAEKGVPLFKTHYAQHLLDATRLFEGVPEILNHFAGKKMAVISNKPEAFTLQILEGLGIRRYFDPVLGGDSLPVKKPDPAPLRRVLQAWKADPAEVLMIGDSSHDMQAAKQAGMRTCGVTYGFRDRAHIQACSPDLIVSGILDLKYCVC